jgi:hypothetical protein
MSEEGKANTFVWTQVTFAVTIFSLLFHKNKVKEITDVNDS